MKVAENGLTDLKCPKCTGHVEKYCNGNHRVFEKRGGRIVCEFCGAERQKFAFNAYRWVYICGCCKKKVDKLYGLFTPHNCKDCQDKAIERDRARGSICRFCKKTFTECYC